MQNYTVEKEAQKSKSIKANQTSELKEHTLV